MPQVQVTITPIEVDSVIKADTNFRLVISSHSGRLYRGPMVTLELFGRTAAFSIADLKAAIASIERAND
jgi:hypothetical protein